MAKDDIRAAVKRCFAQQSWRVFFFLLFATLLLAQCDDGDDLLDQVPQPSVTAFSINNASDLIGGPAAQGALGDFLLKNNKIRVIVQNGGRTAGINLFGGNIIDADRTRDPKKESGKDQWGGMIPLLNREWTVNYFSFEVVSDGSANTPLVLRATGAMDVLDSLKGDQITNAVNLLEETDFKAPFRLSDVNDPFTFSSLKDLSLFVTTDYQINPGEEFVTIKSSIFNEGEEPVSLPVGDLLLPSGELETLLPKSGFAGSAVLDSASALLYGATNRLSNVSYGYFYDPAVWQKASGLAVDGLQTVYLKDGVPDLLRPSGVSSVSVPPQGALEIVRHFAVGTGDTGSVLSIGLVALKIPNTAVSGRVVDSSGQKVEGALVAFLDEETGGTVAVFKTASDGQFGGLLPNGSDDRSRHFGSGRYRIRVEKEGYRGGVVDNGQEFAGSCKNLAEETDRVDLGSGAVQDIECTLGVSGTVVINGVVERISGGLIPTNARLTIVGKDPSPSQGIFHETAGHPTPYGIVGTHLINPNGTIDLTQQAQFSLEPGSYLFVFSKGTEYTLDLRSVTIEAGKRTPLTAVLERAVGTPGFIGADLHTHSLKSPGSHLSSDLRLLSAAAEGLDLVVLTDRDSLTDPSSLKKSLEQATLLPKQKLAVGTGQEIASLVGRLGTFPMTAQPLLATGGAYDGTLTTKDQISPKPDRVKSMAEIISDLKALEGERFVQIHQVMDPAQGLFSLTRLLTTPGFGQPLASFADPIHFRLEPNTNNQGDFVAPFPYGTSSAFAKGFDGIEIVTGLQSGVHGWDDSFNFFRATTLPTWFNLLNLGLVVTATGGSDSKGLLRDPIGWPRSYIASGVDPADHQGTADDLSMTDIAHNLKGHKVVISAGPFLQVHASSGKVRGEVGDLLALTPGSLVNLEINFETPVWAEVDTVEIFVNTNPKPAATSGLQAGRGIIDPATLSPYTQGAASFANEKAPQYQYSPTYLFSTTDQSLILEGKLGSDGKVIAKKGTVTQTITISQDSWIVAMVRGSGGTRSLFPLVPVGLDSAKIPFDTDFFTRIPGTVDAIGGIPAFAIANPIFVDINGDTNNDGEPFEGISIQNGSSPLVNP